VNDTHTLSVNCPGTQHALGGGGGVTTTLATDQGSVQLIQSAPNFTAGAATGWIVTTATNKAVVGSKTIIVYVICSP
jgi:hypothetical protein